MTDPISFPPEDIEGSLHERVRRVAAIRGSAPAVVQGTARVTYEDVDRRSDTLAAAIARLAPVHLSPVIVLVADPACVIYVGLHRPAQGRAPQ